jgi:acetyl-CoA carboxylase biotin carboxylase subunit
MFKKILIANRGEIAVRIITAAKEMGIKTAAVFSDFDRFSLYARIADEAYYIGESPASKSYLLADKIIETAKEAGCDAIHPGYGFLSERGSFAKLCEDNGIKFIGPSSGAIENLGSKTRAKEIAVKNNVPVVPGVEKPISDLQEALSIAANVGYPLLIKASAGGGGKGMRIVRDEKDFESSLRMSQNEARASFGDDSVFIEKYVENGRHIEIQVLADEHGNVVHLGERECSMQRRLQKIVEETPSPAVDEALRAQMGESAKRLASGAGYSNAGTVEFILDKDGKFYFLEMNTRLQVEHPITELRTGLDIVKEQIKVAAGEKLAFSQEDIKFSGHAIECRICAEDPVNGFFPSTGKIEYMSKVLGNGMREDTGVEQGDEISIYYDPMISKLVAYADTREHSIGKMKRALENYTISGVLTNIDFLSRLIESGEFISGRYDTQFVEKVFLDRYLKMQDGIPAEDINALLAGTALLRDSREKETAAEEKPGNGSTQQWLNKKFDTYR